MVRLREVADACGVSVTQASRALAGHADVSAATRARVEQAAARMGYVKNLAAHALSAKSSSQLAVVVPGLGAADENASFLLGVMQGVNAFAAQNGYETVVHLVEKSPDSYETYCRRRGVGGMILMNAPYDDPALRAVLGSNFPCVLIDVPAEGENKGCVLVNNAYYARRAVEELLARGRRNIAMLSGSRHSMVELERRAGYEAALHAAGLCVREELVVYGYFEYARAAEAVEALLRERPEVDGLFCASDLMALGAYGSLRAAGRKIGEDVSVFGFDGLPWGAYAAPPLATVVQDQRRKGWCAAKLLDGILRGEAGERTVLVPCALRAGASV